MHPGPLLPIAIVALALLLIGASPVRAELMVRDTIELRAARADVIVHANVASFSGHTASLHVLDVLKGRAPDTLSIELWPDPDAGEHEQALFFFRRTTDDGLELDKSPVTDGVIWLDRQRPGAYTMNFESLRGREDIIAAVRSSMNAAKPSKVIAVEVPFFTDGGVQLVAGEAGFLRMPVDHRLESCARSWLARGNHWPAVVALREFRSEENARALASVLQSTNIVSTGGVGRLSFVEFPVRRLAWQTLGDWNVPAPRPVLRAPDDYYHALTPLRLVIVGFAVALPALVAVIVSRRRRFRNGTAAMLATLAVASVVLWIHTRSRFGDEFYYDGATRQMWLSSHGGWLQWTAIADWSPPPAERQIYVPFSDWLTEPPAGRDLTPTPAHVPRGLLWGAIPDCQSLFQNGPNRVTRDENWHVAALLTGLQQDWGREGMFPFRRLQLRWALVVPLLAAYPMLRMMFVTLSALRARHRRRHGLCVDCGYDLRGSADRCPECGMAAAVSR